MATRTAYTSIAPPTINVRDLDRQLPDAETDAQIMPPQNAPQLFRSEQPPARISVEASVAGHSVRNASMGSTEAARRAGAKAAHPETTANAAIASPKLAGSNGEIP